MRSVLLGLVAALALTPAVRADHCDSAFVQSVQFQQVAFPVVQAIVTPVVQVQAFAFPVVQRVQVQRVQKVQVQEVRQKVVQTQTVRTRVR
jgi:hypothetical protein